MKHRALSMLLALLMVVSLLPVAAIANGAEENTGAEEQEETVEMGRMILSRVAMERNLSCRQKRRKDSHSALCREKRWRDLLHTVSV